jgi:hypothetical protein
MTFIYSDDGVTIDMREYIKAMIDEFPYEIGERTSPTPANDDLFTIKDSPYLDKIQSEELHTFVAKAYLLARGQDRIYTQQQLFYVHVSSNRPKTIGLNYFG